MAAYRLLPTTMPTTSLAPVLDHHRQWLSRWLALAAAALAEVAKMVLMVMTTPNFSAMRIILLHSNLKFDASMEKITRSGPKP